MIDEIQSQPLGPAGVAERMAQIQAKMAAFNGLTPQNGGVASFSAAMANQQNAAGLTGSIGDADNKPLSPFGGGVGVESTVPAELRTMIQQAATKNGVDPDLLDALVQQESGYSTTARSGVGAMGLTQLMPHTAAGLGVTNPFDPAQNLDGGAKYLKQQISRFGDVGTALAAYNAGPGAVMKYGGIPPFRETQAYVRNILSRVERTKALPHG
jgi:soluble lytic murein transglycosylase-like protein